MGWNKIKEIQKWNSRRIKTQRKKDKKKKMKKIQIAQNYHSF